MKTIATFFWRRLDMPGHDACRLLRLATGWKLSGAAVFLDGRRPCHLVYEVLVDAGWRTRRAAITGFIAGTPVDVRIHRAERRSWLFNDQHVQGLEDCVDVDLGFTPSTNQLALRRMALRVGARAEAPAAYLQFPEMRLVRLPQTYLRATATQYEYASPTVGYAGRLTVNRSGAVTHYPELFELMNASHSPTR
jgi:uncharacterized protein